MPVKIDKEAKLKARIIRKSKRPLITPPREQWKPYNPQFYP